MQAKFAYKRKKKAEGPMKMQNTDTLAFTCLLSNHPKLSDKNSKFLMLAQVSKNIYITVATTLVSLIMSPREPSSVR